jgi:hypothetical protein
VTYYLNDLKSITKVDDKLKQTTSNGQHVHLDVYAFELLFKNEDATNGDTNGGADDDKFRFVWQCNKPEERNDFLDTLWKLSEQFLKKSERPKFINYHFESEPIFSPFLLNSFFVFLKMDFILEKKSEPEKGASSAAGAVSDTSSQNRKNSILEAQNTDANHYEINRSDEDSLVKLMSECNFVSSNAEKFIEKLQTELLDLDTVC